MKTRCNIEPQIEHYGCMVDLFGQAGQLVEAEQLIRTMAWKADVMIWGALLTACGRFGDIEIAERVVEEIVVLDPENHGVHVVLSNMYAEARRWEDVLKLRKRLKEGNLKKIPGPCPDDRLWSHPRQLRSQQASLLLSRFGFWGYQLCCKALQLVSRTQ
ncbi:hypothetical protein Cgig2_022705 [Carnegiea gigantea]|uniref:Pentatricopeptide repeat-containing protein n=1 Tax=Carnegiea gigantea TaxID=171969 RepID=A0A9Q1K4V9_9CARY|nr:hypothetical protein Cgig2_022705 [Carnegiea gigantea]